MFTCARILRESDNSPSQMSTINHSKIQQINEQSQTKLNWHRYQITKWIEKTILTFDWQTFCHLNWLFGIRVFSVHAIEWTICFDRCHNLLSFLINSFRFVGFGRFSMFNSPVFRCSMWFSAEHWHFAWNRECTQIHQREDDVNYWCHANRWQKTDNGRNSSERGAWSQLESARVWPSKLTKTTEWNMDGISPSNVEQDAFTSITICFLNLSALFLFRIGRIASFEWCRFRDFHHQKSIFSRKNVRFSCEIRVFFLRKSIWVEIHRVWDWWALFVLTTDFA